ncbi:MAG: RNA polymerase sigma factor [Bacillota bacterium]
MHVEGGCVLSANPVPSETTTASVTSPAESDPVTPALVPALTCLGLLSDEDLVGMTLDNPNRDAAFAVLVERHQTAVRRVARGILGRSPDVDDVVQSAFISAFRSLHTLKDRARFKYWVRMIAINEARDVAAGSLEVAGLDELMILPEQASDRLPADVAEARWLIDELTERIPMQYMRVLYLRYYLDYTVNEVAEMLGIDPGLVKWRANRARRLAREALSAAAGPRKEGGNKYGQTQPS